MSTSSVEEFDVVIIGGGPGGSTLAALVAKQGHRVLVLEKEYFPRFQIGESLLPSTIHGICRLTGAYDAVVDAGFTRKRGGTFRWGENPEPWTFSFGVSPRMEGQTSYAYQVERSKFDEILLRNASKVGADVREGCAVTGLLTEGDRVSGVTYTADDGQLRKATARFVVDASGNKSRFHNEVGGTRSYSDFFRSLALFGYFTGGKRLPEPNNGNILCAAFDDGWFWYIPLSETLTSVGAVVRREMAEKIQGDPEEAMRGLIAECPMISDYLSDAERVTEGQYGQLRVRKDYSYHQTKFWKPGLVLIGDAACFVDPVFSSGVHLATYSALLAARSINSVLSGTLDEELALTEFESRYRHEYGVFYEFLISFYEMHSSETSYFWNAKKVIKSSSTELEAFVDLVGGVSSGDAGLATADAAASRFLERSEEFADAVETMRGDKDQSMVPLFKSQLIRQAMQEGSDVQMRAILGEDAEAAVPMFEGGLAPSRDGLSWVAAAEG
ncbi:MAG: tryptophan 7-halogenase [Nocardiopsaceae bacterium]|nr:tryptophan 7-halogenase [Nocardiopsaceae bacterium]